MGHIGQYDLNREGSLRPLQVQVGLEGKRTHPGVEQRTLRLAGSPPALCEADVPALQGGQGQGLGRGGHPPAHLRYVILWLVHQARLHSQVPQTTAADKVVSGLGASTGTLSP